MYIFDMKASKLSEDFIVPPYSVFDTRLGYWKRRKKMWKDWLGATTMTRENTLYDNLELKLPGLYVASQPERERLKISFKEYVENHVSEKELSRWSAIDILNGASSFDPVLAEIAYKWFAPSEGSKVFDCCAGGLTKGAVASKCGHRFFGIDIREEQIQVNKLQAETIGVDAHYVSDDGIEVLHHLGCATQDLLISCPPYYNLEVYSDERADLSNAPDYATFISRFDAIYSNAIKCLKRNRFAVIIVGDVRDRSGHCHNFPGDVINIFERHGCCLYNDIVIIGNDAHAKIRARQYMNNRKIVRMHQRMLVFYNGKPSTISKNFNPLAELSREI